jgi:hypothetical protein
VEGASFDPYKNETSFDFSIDVGGNQGSRGGNSGQEFFIENVLDELDAPSEFFYNASSAQLWLWYNGTAQPPADGSIEITQLSTLISAVGNQRWVADGGTCCCVRCARCGALLPAQPQRASLPPHTAPVMNHFSRASAVTPSLASPFWA